MIKHSLVTGSISINESSQAKRYAVFELLMVYHSARPGDKLE